jgi:hypothetical protein
MKVFILMKQSGWINFAGRYTNPPVIVDVFSDKKDAKLAARSRSLMARSSHYYVKTKELK